MTIRKGLTALAVLAVLAACGDDEVILVGERLDVRAPFEPTVLETEGVAPAQPVARFAPPPAVANASWTHVAGGPAHDAPHAAFTRGAPRLAWSARIGEGNSRKHRITAAPIVAGNLVVAMGSQSTVTALSTGGGTVWSRNLTPSYERARDATGGGLAYDGGRVYVTTGFGQVVALDARTGAEIWRQDLDAAAVAAPTVRGGLVYAVSRDNRAWAIDAANGKVQWTLQGTPSSSGFLGGAAPAVTDRVAIFPFNSGELIAALRQGGLRLWDAPIVGQRKGAVYAQITDITGDPVVVGDRIYTGNQSGRAMAVSLNSGERIWTARHGAYGAPAVAGGSVFLISDKAELVRLDAATGQEVWSLELPYFRNERARRSESIYTHFGPVLAGGTLWVASDDGTLRGFDPASGRLRLAVPVPGGAAAPMAVAGGTMYVVSTRGQLHAFR